MSRRDRLPSVPFAVQVVLMAPRPVAGMKGKTKGVVLGLGVFALAAAGAAVLRPARAPESNLSVRRLRWIDVQVPPVPSDLASLVQEGTEIHKTRCAVCHGEQGKGDGPGAALLDHRPRDYTRGNFKFRTSPLGETPFDDDLFRTITCGIAAAGMPSFAALPEHDRWALVACVKSLARRTDEDGETFNQFEMRPATLRVAYATAGRSVSADAARLGDALFHGSKGGCILCHGPEGKGDGISSKDLKDDADLPIHPANLTRGLVGFKTGERPEDVFRVVTNGMAGTPMPSFRVNLSDEERWQLACYVTSLFRPVPRGEAAFLVGGCKTCHTIGRGKLIGPDLAGVVARRGEEGMKTYLADRSAPADGCAARTAERGLAGTDAEAVIAYLRDWR